MHWWDWTQISWGAIPFFWLFLKALSAAGVCGGIKRHTTVSLLTCVLYKQSAFTNDGKERHLNFSCLQTGKKTKQPTLIRMRVQFTKVCGFVPYCILQHPEVMRSRLKRALNVSKHSPNGAPRAAVGENRSKQSQSRFSADRNGDGNGINDPTVAFTEIDMSKGGLWEKDHLMLKEELLTSLYSLSSVSYNPTILFFQKPVTRSLMEFRLQVSGRVFYSLCIPHIGKDRKE